MKRIALGVLWALMMAPRIRRRRDPRDVLGWICRRYPVRDTMPWTLSMSAYLDRLDARVAVARA